MGDNEIRRGAVAEGIVKSFAIKGFRTQYGSKALKGCDAHKSWRLLLIKSTKTRSNEGHNAPKCAENGAKWAKKGKRRQKKIIFDRALRHEF